MYAITTCPSVNEKKSEIFFFFLAGSNYGFPSENFTVSIENCFFFFYRRKMSRLRYRNSGTCFFLNSAITPSCQTWTQSKAIYQLLPTITIWHCGGNLKKTTTRASERDFESWNNTAFNSSQTQIARGHTHTHTHRLSILFSPSKRFLGLFTKLEKPFGPQSNAPAGLLQRGYLQK